MKLHSGRLKCIWKLALLMPFISNQAADLSIPFAVAPAPIVTASIDELKKLSLEELMNLEVISVSRQPKRFSEVASAISVLTQEDITRSGALTIPDALRYAPGLHVAQFAGRSYAISARGFNSLAANKMMVLRDGRSLYTPLFSGVFWEVQDAMLEDLDRIEVIRGPGATMWGADAVNGVINIISKSAEETQGTLITGGGGTEERAFGGVRYGGKAGENTYYRAYLKYFHRDSQEFPNGHSAGDASHHGQGGFRLDSKLTEENLLTIQGDVYGNEFGLRNRDDSENSGGNILSRWTRQFSEESATQLQVYYDRSKRDVPLQFSEDRSTYDIDFQHFFPAGERNQLVWGLNYRHSTDETGDSGTVQFDPRDRSINIVSAFLQNEIALIPDHLGLTVGSKFEHNDFTGFEVQPSARLAWTPVEQHTIWTAVSRAVRTPTRFDEDIRFIPNPASGAVLIRGDRDFLSEAVIAYELGYRVQPHERVTLDLATFYNDYDNLRSQEPTPGTILPLVLMNELKGEAYGAELAIKYQLTEWWRLSGSYTYLERRLEFTEKSADPSGGSAEGNDPHHIFSLRSSMDFPHRVFFDTGIRYVDALPNPYVPSYLVMDARLAWEARDGLELAIVGQNLLEYRHAEFGQQSPTAPQVEQGIYGKVTWRF